MAIPGYISEITHVYLLLDIFNVVQSSFPITPGKSMGSSTGRARVEKKDGITAGEATPAVSSVFLLVEATTWGKVWLHWKIRL